MGSLDGNFGGLAAQCDSALLRYLGFLAPSKKLFPSLGRRSCSGHLPAACRGSEAGAARAQPRAGPEPREAEAGRGSTRRTNIKESEHKGERAQGEPQARLLWLPWRAESRRLLASCWSSVGAPVPSERKGKLYGSFVSLREKKEAPSKFHFPQREKGSSVRPPLPSERKPAPSRTTSHEGGIS